MSKSPVASEPASQLPRPRLQAAQTLLVLHDGRAKEGRPVLTWKPSFTKRREGKGQREASYRKEAGKMDKAGE